MAMAPRAGAGAGPRLAPALAFALRSPCCASRFASIGDGLSARPIAVAVSGAVSARRAVRAAGRAPAFVWGDRSGGGDVGRWRAR